MAAFWKKFLEYSTVSDTGESYTSRQDPGSNGPWRVTKSGVTYIYFLTASRADLRFKMVRTSNGSSLTELDSANAPPWTNMSPTSTNPGLWSADFGENGDGDLVAYLAFTDGTPISGSTDDWKLYHTEPPGDPVLRMGDDGQFVPIVIPVKTYRFDFVTDTWHALADGPVVCVNFETGKQGFTPNSPNSRGLLIRISPDNDTAVLYHGSWPTINTITNLTPDAGGAGYIHDYLQNTLGTTTYTEGSGWGSFVDMTPSPGAYGQENYWVQAYNDFGTDYGVIVVQVNTYTGTSSVFVNGTPSPTLTFSTVGFTATIHPPNLDPSFGYGSDSQMMVGFISRFRMKQGSGTSRLFLAFINVDSQLVLVDAKHSIVAVIPVTVGTDNFNVIAEPNSTNSYGGTVQTFTLRGATAVVWSNFYQEYLGSGTNYGNPNIRFMVIDGADATFSAPSLGDMFEIDLTGVIIQANGIPNQISELGMFASPWNCMATPVDSMWQFKLFWLESPPEPRVVILASAGRVSIAY